MSAISKISRMMAKTMAAVALESSGTVQHGQRT